MAEVTWTTVKLAADAQSIPRLCPNCLQPSTREFRYANLPPLISRLFASGRFFQTFNYCEECVPVLAAGIDSHRWFYLQHPYCVIVVGGALTALIRYSLPDWFGKDSPASYGLFAGCILLAVGVFEPFARWNEGRYRRRVPKQDFQAVWGAAAYCTKIGYQEAEYQAARPEWIAALVQANPEQVDDATYQRIVGQPKPSSGRPFA